MKARYRAEGLRTARLFMVLSSISPLFILWAIRGTNLMSDAYFLGFCSLMVVVPNGFLWLRIRAAKKCNERRELVIGTSEDHREHLLVYLFAMLLPFYADNLATWRAFVGALAAVSFIVFLFWHLNLHYMNILSALLGYHVFTVYPSVDGNRISGRTSYVLITPRVSLFTDEHITAYRISDTVYLEVD